MNPLDGSAGEIKPGVCLSWTAGRLSHVAIWHAQHLVKQRRWSSLQKQKENKFRKITALELCRFHFAANLEACFDKAGVGLVKQQCGRHRTARR